MPLETNWYETISIPALLRSARTLYGGAMRKALEEAGYDDIPKNGLFIIGGLALEEHEVPLSALIEELGLSKQSAGQLVDTLVVRGYLDRKADPNDRRRLIVTLTERGRAAAQAQTGGRQRIDDALTARIGKPGMLALRKALAALTTLKKGASPDEIRAKSAARLTGVVPILFVRDVTRAARFFEDELGFQIDFLYGEPPFYGSVSRDEARLHLRFVGKPNFVELAAKEESLILATVEVSDVQALYAEFEERGVEFARGIEEQVWGGIDFHVRDPDGNEISFVEYRNPGAQDAQAS